MKVELYTIGFGRPDLLRQQKRLLDKYLQDDFGLCLIDNTPGQQKFEMQRVCGEIGVGYMCSPSEKNLHDEALNFAALLVTRMQDLGRGHEFFGFLDHDIFPRRETTLIDKLIETGFYGVGQRHAPTGTEYLWPGLCFFSQEWLDGRKLDFGGIRGARKRDDGDTGSANWPLFTSADWRALHGMEHGYMALRNPDSVGLQSWGYELLGDWLHLTNSSHWMEIPDPEERDRLALAVVEAL